MVQWSQDEVNRTIDEIKRRSLVDPDFRALALANPLAAIAKINPKSLPAGLSIKFIAGADEIYSSAESEQELRIALPQPVEGADELSDAELEQAAGGKSDIKFPIE